jgi:hypothetical protein
VYAAVRAENGARRRAAVRLGRTPALSAAAPRRCGCTAGAGSHFTERKQSCERRRRVSGEGDRRRSRGRAAADWSREEQERRRPHPGGAAEKSGSPIGRCWRSARGPGWAGTEAAGLPSSAARHRVWGRRAPWAWGVGTARGLTTRGPSPRSRRNSPGPPRAQATPPSARRPPCRRANEQDSGCPASASRC